MSQLPRQLRRRAVNQAYDAPERISPFSRACPRCEAQPGMACRRWIPAAGYYRTHKTVHDERRAKRGGGE